MCISKELQSIPIFLILDEKKNKYCDKGEVSTSLFLPSLFYFLHSFLVDYFHHNETKRKKINILYPTAIVLSLQISHVIYKAHVNLKSKSCCFSAYLDTQSKIDNSPPSAPLKSHLRIARYHRNLILDTLPNGQQSSLYI